MHGWLQEPQFNRKLKHTGEKVSVSLKLYTAVLELSPLMMVSLSARCSDRVRIPPNLAHLTLIGQLGKLSELTPPIGETNLTLRSCISRVTQLQIIISVRKTLALLRLASTSSCCSLWMTTLGRTTSTSTRVNQGVMLIFRALLSRLLQTSDST